MAVAAAAGLGTLQALGPLPHPAPAAPPAAKPADSHAHAEPAAPPARPRVAAPDDALLGPARPSGDRLPRIAPDGRMARTVYAAPYTPPAAGVPRIALLLSGYGLSERDSRAASDQVPAAVSFAVSPYATAPEPLLEAARIAGHELLASIPMEPDAYPQNDAGPRSLRTGLSPDENRQNLAWALARTQGAVGATAAADGQRGERFAAVGAALDGVLDEVARRGLLYIDPRPGQAPHRPGLTGRAADIVVDDQLGRAEIDSRLAALERTARERGSALGVAGPLRPATVERIAAWSKTLQDRGLALVPVSALVGP